MKDYNPYRFWTHEQLFLHCEKQCYHYGQEDLIPLVKEIIYDVRWFPMKDYNGCNMVQDMFHPYVPCLIHDYRWFVEKGGLKTDIEFRTNLQNFGTSKSRSIAMFYGVRLGWFFYFKWNKMFKRLRR